MFRRILRAIVLAVVVATVAVPVHAQERVDEAAMARIRMEGFQHSHVMETLSWISDVYGPRLTGSANYRKAAEWARDRLGEWGLSGARLDAWGDVGPAWSVQGFSVEMTEPSYNRLVAYPVAWAPSTEGVVRGTPVLVEISSPADYDRYRGKLAGAIVMLGRPSRPASLFEAPSTRWTAEQLDSMAAITDPGRPGSYREEEDEWLEELARAQATMDFLKGEGIAVLLQPSRRDDNVVAVSGIGDIVHARPAFPAFVVSREQYGRILRILEKDVPVTLEISLATRRDDSDGKGYNVVAEIPGSDPALRDQVVMLGGHFDSWHAGTGAVDNGAGSAVAMEAVRILQALGVKPRRTVRIALWGGEEQDYFGSAGYVKAHYGDPMTGQAEPAAREVSAYFNLDNGSGRVRGVYLQGNELVRPIFAAWLAPFRDLGATTLTASNTGGTDHMSFAAVGIPAFQFIQDPLDYDTRRHHTSLDVYEAAVEEDLQQAAVIMAAFVYDAAMRDEMLPRAGG
jgi:carboxypeptidase Q